VGYTVRSRATDNDANVETPGTGNHFWFDAQAPSSTVTTPANGQWYSSTFSLSGTASDGSGCSGIDKVEVSIQRDSDHKYWNGAIWGSTETWLSTSGTTAWTKSSGLPTWQSCEGYTVRSRATDNATNVETPTAGNSFDYDAQAPSSTVTTPANGQWYNSTFSLSGTASDGGSSCSGVNKVEVSIQRDTSPHHWNGTTWGSTETWLSTSGTTAWAKSSGLPTWQSCEGYTVRSRATDNATNVETPGTGNSFDYDALAPAIASPSIVEDSDYLHAVGTKLYYSDKMSLGELFQLQGTGSDSGCSGLDRLTCAAALGEGPFQDNSPDSWTCGYYIVENSDTENGSIDAVLYDVATNTDAETFTYERDVTDPTSSASSPAYALTMPIAVDWEAADSQAGLQEVCLWYKLETGGTWTKSSHCSAATSGTWNFEPPGTITGTYYFQTVAEDHVTNVELGPSGEGDSQTTYDPNAPGIVYHTPSAHGDTEWYNAEPDPNTVIDVDFLNGGKRGLDQAQYRVNGGGWQDIFDFTCRSGVGNFKENWAVKWSLLPEGENEIDVQVKKCGGGWITDAYEAGEAGFRYRVDRVKPTSDAEPPETGIQGEALHIDWTANDDTSGVQTVTLWYKTEGSTWQTSGLAQSGISDTIAFTPTEAITYYFQTIALDYAGNQEAGPDGLGDGSTLVVPPKHLRFLPLVLRSYPPPPACSKSDKTADKEALNSGDTLEYTITLRNDEKEEIDVSLSDPIPVHTSYIGDSASGCTHSDGKITWSGKLEGEGSHTCTFSVKVNDDASGEIDNQATVSCPDQVPLNLSLPVMVTNGGFETGDTSGWETSGSGPLHAPQAVAREPHAGSYDLLLGTPDVCNAPDPGATGNHASIARQTIYVPDVEGTPVLKFSYRMLTYDHLTWTDGRLGDSFDVQVGGELALHDNYENLPNPSPGCGNLQDSGWREPGNPWGGEVDSNVLDLSEWKGKAVEIRFENWTRWDGYYNTWTYIDDVRVEIASP